MKKRTLLKIIWLKILIWLRQNRQLWKCPLCFKVNRFITDNILDTYPYIDPKNAKPCCLQKFLLWYYK